MPPLGERPQSRQTRQTRQSRESRVMPVRRVFSATRAKDREELGEVITRWLRANPGLVIVDKVVTQSSDREFHCLTITLFYRE